MNGITTCTLLVLLSAASGEGEQWSQFRGPGGRGIAADPAPLPAVLDPEHNLLWSCALPPGHSSPSVWGERIFLTASAEEELQTICVDRARGEVLWRQTVPLGELGRMHRVNSPAASTPCADAEHVYAYFGSFGLVCYDHEGEEVWRRELPPPKNTFGSAASPVLAGGMLIFLSDSNESSWLEAIDPETGETLWKRDRSGFKSGWSTPALWQRDGADELVVYGVWWMTAYDLADGAERWSVPGLTDEPIITPVTGEGLVFVTSYNMRTNPEVIGLPPWDELLGEYDADDDGELTYAEIEDNQSILSRYDADGEGDHPLRIFFRFLDEDESADLTGEEYAKLFAWLEGFEHANALLAIRPGDGERETEVVWQHAQGVPECPSPLYYDGRVYMIKNGGIASCLDAATGELHYQERLESRGPHYASPVAGDGKVYTASARGVVHVLAAGDTLEVLSRADLGERIMATPALVDGKVYLRTEARLLAFGAAE